VAAGVAVAALGTGIALGVSASNASHTLQNPPAMLPAGTSQHDYNQGLVNQIGTESLAADILYGVAGAAAVGSVGLFFLEGQP
jgi:hypothetical protein